MTEAERTAFFSIMEGQLHLCVKATQSSAGGYAHKHKLMDEFENPLQLGDVSYT